jgi:hypothetical protein
MASGVQLRDYGIPFGQGILGVDAISRIPRCDRLSVCGFGNRDQAEDRDAACDADPPGEF